MSRLLGLLKTMRRRSFSRRSFYWRSLLCLGLALAAGGFYFWKPHPPLSTPLPSRSEPMLPPLAQETEAHTTEDNEEEEMEEEEEREEDVSSPSEKRWSLLKTTLPARYDAPSVNTASPTVAVILTGLGFQPDQPAQILKTLTKKITFAFSPYGPYSTEQLLHVTRCGCQGLMAVPLEPYDPSRTDPGPLALLTSARAEENLQKLETILAKAPKGTGLMVSNGSPFTTGQADLEPVLKHLKAVGSFLVEAPSALHSSVQKTCKALGMPCPQVDLTLPVSASQAEEEEFFKKIIPLARESGIIIISVPAIPVFMDHLAEWMRALQEEGVTFATIADLKPSEPQG